LTEATSNLALAAELVSGTVADVWLKTAAEKKILRPTLANARVISTLTPRVDTTCKDLAVGLSS
jgi:hypothetical protein